jgi:hypothetical protein
MQSRGPVDASRILGMLRRGGTLLRKNLDREIEAAKHKN